MLVAVSDHAVPTDDHAREPGIERGNPMRHRATVSRGVGPLSLLLPLLLLLTVLPAQAAAPPPNDDIDQATPITTLPFTDELDSTDATRAPDDPECIFEGHTVWYALTLGATTPVAITTAGSDYDTTLAAYTGTRGNLEEVACNDDVAEALHSRIRFTAEADTTYFIMVGAFDDSPGGQLVVTAEERVLPPPPPNDTIDQAVPITTLPFTDELDVSGATRAPEDPVCLGEGGTVWYALTLAEETRVELNTFGSDYDTTLAAYTDDEGALTEIACNDDTRDLQSRIRFTAGADTTYLIMVSAFQEDEFGGQLVLNASERTTAAPSNDDIDQATPITSLPFSDELDTTEATRAPDDPMCVGDGPTVWYALTLETETRVELNTFDSDYDTTLSAYVGEPGNLKEVACDDDTRGLQSRIRFTAEADTTYFIMVGAFGPDDGGLLHLTARALGTDEPLEPEEPEEPEEEGGEAPGDGAEVVDEETGGPEPGDGAEVVDDDTEGAEELPKTGGPIGMLTGLAGMLLLAGATTLAAGRRRHRTIR
jgi:hypothetical protein